MGVSHRIGQLSDRGEGFVLPQGKPFESLVPLPEVIAACLGYSAASKKVQNQYFGLLRGLGPEFDILRNIPLEDIRRISDPLVAEGISRLREGKVKRIPGYDGEYGIIKLFDTDEISAGKK